MTPPSHIPQERNELTIGAAAQMESTRTGPDRNRWDEVHFEDSISRMARVGPRRGHKVQTVALWVATTILHGCIAYFGWQWINSLRASAAIATPPVIKSHPVREPLPAPEVRSTPRSRAGRRSPTLQETPILPKNVKCIDGVPYTTRIGDDGSTVIEILKINGRRATCRTQ